MDIARQIPYNTLASARETLKKARLNFDWIWAEYQKARLEDYERVEKSLEKARIAKVEAILAFEKAWEDYIQKS